MKRMLVGLLLVLSVLALFPVQFASADTFNPNNIMDDSVFDNASSMSAAQIDSFLNDATRFPNSCISSRNGFSSPDPIGYSPATSYVFGANVTAGTVIAHAAQAYDINPQVLLATLQKEQSLVSGEAGCHPNTPDPNASFKCNLWGDGTLYDCTNACQFSGGCINIAVGNDCPYYCKASSEGFSKQVISAAWKLKFWEQRSKGNVQWNIQKPGWDNSDDPPTCYTGAMTQGYRARSNSSAICAGAPGNQLTYYDGLTTVNAGGTTVRLDSGATAALYRFTPFTSGNTSFFNIFTNWFGSTFGMIVRTPTNPTYYLLTNGTKYAIASGDILYAYNLQNQPLRVVDDAYLNTISDGGVLNTIFTLPSDPTVYLADGGKMYGIASGSYCTAWGLACGNAAVQKQIGQDVASLMTSGGTLTNVGKFQNKVFLMENGSQRVFLNGQAITDAGYASTPVVNIVNWTNAIRPQGYSFPQNNSVVKFGSSPALYLYTGGSFYGFSSMASFSSWTTPSTPISYDSSSLYATQPPVVTTALAEMLTVNGSTYMVYGGKRLDVTSLGPWGSVPVINSISAYLNTLTNAGTASASNTYRLPNGAIYALSNQQKRPFYGVRDFFALGNQQTSLINVTSDATLDNVPSGPALIAEQSLFKIPGDPATIFVATNGNKRSSLTSLAQLQQFKLDSSNVRTIDATTTSAISYNGVLESGFTDIAGSAYIMTTNGNYVTVSTQRLADWGITTTTWPVFGTTSMSRYVNVGSLGIFAQSQAGTIYYAQGGQKHPISSFDKFKQLGGNSSNTLLLNDDVLSQSPTGAAL